MAIWPASLPQYPRVGTLTVTYSQSTVDFVTDSGARIRRVKQTDSFKKWAGTYQMTSEQHDAFWDFYNETTNRGIDQFTITDPSAGQSVTAEFDDLEPPTATWIAPGYYEIPLSFRILS